MLLSIKHCLSDRQKNYGEVQNVKQATLLQIQTCLFLRGHWQHYNEPNYLETSKDNKNDDDVDDDDGDGYLEEKKMGYVAGRE